MPDYMTPSTKVSPKPRARLWPGSTLMTNIPLGPSKSWETSSLLSQKYSGLRLCTPYAGMNLGEPCHAGPRTLTVARGFSGVRICRGRVGMPDRGFSKNPSFGGDPYGNGQEDSWTLRSALPAILSFGRGSTNM